MSATFKTVDVALPDGTFAQYTRQYTDVLGAKATVRIEYGVVDIYADYLLPNIRQDARSQVYPSGAMYKEVWAYRPQTDVFFGKLVIVFYIR
jgi:hypothetical protein